MNSNRKKGTFGMVCTLACANTALYGLPYMKNQFYDIMMEVLHLSHTQLSMLFSINGAVCMAAYIVGGILTDYFSVKKLMIGALLVSGILHIYVITVPGYPVLCAIYALLAATSVLIFYPASMKTLTYLGEDKKRGSIFGYYIAIIDIIGIVVVGIGLFVMVITKKSETVFRSIILLYGGLHFIAAFFLHWLFEEQKYREEGNRIKWSAIMKILTDRKVWGVVAVIFSNYLMMSAMTYAVPFLSQVYGMSEQKILTLSIIRVNVIAVIAAPLSGKVVDRTGSAVRFMLATFLCSLLLAVGLIMSFYIFIPVWLIIGIILLITSVVVSAKSLNLVALSEIGISPAYMGTAIGAVSFFGYSPDAFFYSFAGMSIDRFQIEGYKAIFLAFFVCSVVGAAASVFLLRTMKREKNRERR